MLTAKHAIRDHRSFSVLCPDVGQERLHSVDAIVHPHVDVALLPISNEGLVERAYSVEVFGEVATVAKGTQVVVTGFPAHMSLLDADDLGPIQRYADITHFGFAAGSDANAISVRWREAEFDDDRAAGLARFGMEPGKQPLKKPAGISGGGAWLWSRVESNQLWSPTSTIRLVGVSYEFSNGKQLASPVWCWRDWLLDRIN